MRRTPGPAPIPSLALGLVLALASPARADDPPADLRGLMERMLGAVDPWLADLAETLGDLSGWQAPEVLPNGDILIRRRRPPEADQPSAPAPGESVEL